MRSMQKSTFHAVPWSPGWSWRTPVGPSLGSRPRPTRLAQAATSGLRPSSVAGIGAAGALATALALPKKYALPKQVAWGLAAVMGMTGLGLVLTGN